MLLAMLADCAYMDQWCICVFVEHHAPSSRNLHQLLVDHIR